MGHCQHFSNTMYIQNQNKKGDGSNIINLDTIKGCTNACESCYAKRTTARAITHFDHPVKIEKYIGSPKEEYIYRFGCTGEPALDWEHSASLIKKYGFQKYFFLTKLQSIKGFCDTINRIQVSLDPLNKRHFDISLNNVKQLLKTFPKTKIVLRLRSCDSKNKEIVCQSRRAVQFAKYHNIPIIETRIRFLRKEAFEKYSLDPASYSYRKAYMRPNKGIHFVATPYVCDIKEQNCKGCGLCEKLMGL